MTTIRSVNAVMPAGGHASAARPVLARPGLRELVSVCPASGEPTVVRRVLPGSASFKPASRRVLGRSRRLGPDLEKPPHWPGRPSGPPRPPCPRSSSLVHPLYLYLPERPAAALPGCSTDPGRDMLCLLTSPPRWLQWP